MSSRMFSEVCGLPLPPHVIDNLNNDNHNNDNLNNDHLKNNSTTNSTTNTKSTMEMMRI